MHIVFGFLGVIASFLILRYREAIGNMLGEAEWMNKIGGVYNAVVIISIIGFFWSIAYMTGTTHIFFKPLLFFLPGVRDNADSGFYIE